MSILDDGEVISNDASKVCGTSSAAARTADTSDECATFRLYGPSKGTLGFFRFPIKNSNFH